jgi:hypothetical protein
VDADIALPPVVPPTTRLWVDAYTMQLEAIAEIMANPQTRKSVEDAVKKAEADLAANTDPTKDEQLMSLVANQKQILFEMGTFNLEAYRDLMSRWRSVRDQILMAGWDLNVDLDFDPVEALGIVNVSQGGGKPKPFMAAEAQVMLAFIQFVSNKQDSISPQEHAKQMLLKQGINADNFHEHQDRLGISNPWGDSTPKPKNIIQGNFR